MVGRRAHREESPVRVERELGLRHRVAGMGVALQAFRAVGGPAHRPPEPAGGDHAERVLGIDRVLHPEPAADIGADHPEIALRLVEDVRQVTALRVR